MTKLSLELSKYEQAINKLYDEVYFGFHMLDEILSRFPPRYLVHNGTTRQVSSPTILDTSPKPYRSKFSIEVGMFHQTDVTKFRDYLCQLVTSLQNQQKAHTFEIMSETCEATGNNIDGKGRNFWEVYIESLEKLDYRFDSYNCYVTSETMKQVRETPMTQEQFERAVETVNAKRADFLAKKRSRRLA